MPATATVETTANDSFGFEISRDANFQVIGNASLAREFPAATDRVNDTHTYATRARPREINKTTARSAAAGFAIAAAFRWF